MLDDVQARERCWGAQGAEMTVAGAAAAAWRSAAAGACRTPLRAARAPLEQPLPLTTTATRCTCPMIAAQALLADADLPLLSLCRAAPPRLPRQCTAAPASLDARCQCWEPVCTDPRHTWQHACSICQTSTTDRQHRAAQMAALSGCSLLLRTVPGPAPNLIASCPTPSSAAKSATSKSWRCRSSGRVSLTAWRCSGVPQAQCCKHQAGNGAVAPALQQRVQTPLLRGRAGASGVGMRTRGAQEREQSALRAMPQPHAHLGGLLPGRQPVHQR